MKLSAHARVLLNKIPDEIKPHPGWDDFIFWGDAMRTLESIGLTDTNEKDTSPLKKIISIGENSHSRDYFESMLGHSIPLPRFLQEIKLARCGEQGIFKKNYTENPVVIVADRDNCLWLASVWWNNHRSVQKWEMWAANAKLVYITSPTDVYGY